MKKCLQCTTIFEGADFICPKCGFSPSIINGFAAFSPEKAEYGEGFPVESFSTLYEMEAKSFWFRSRNRMILWALDRFSRNAESLLEVGCGTGFVLDGISIHRPKIDLWGGDLFIEALNFAAGRLGGRARLCQMDALKIPFKDEFDVIGAFDVLEHIKDDEAALTQIHQALVPGGRVIITVPQHRWLWSEIDRLSRHQRRYSLNGLKEKMNSVGFGFIHAVSFVSLLMPLMFFTRLRKVKTLQQAGRQLNLPDSLNNLLEGCMKVEYHMILSGFSIPWGGSVMVIGSKPVGIP